MSYTLTIVLATLRICECRYTRSGQMNEILARLHGSGLAYRLDKLDELPSRMRLLPKPSSSVPVPVPPGEGVETLGHVPPARIDPRLDQPNISQGTAPPHAEAGPSSRPPSAPVPQQHPYHAEVRRDPTVASSSFTPSPSSPPPQASAFGFDSSEDQEAVAAMVMDGSRFNAEPGMAVPPPYSPGRRPGMTGHGSESNDMRLSEYVKGGTRAQDMKDSSRF